MTADRSKSKNVRATFDDRALSSKSPHQESSEFQAFQPLGSPFVVKRQRARHWIVGWSCPCWIGRGGVTLPGHERPQLANSGQREQIELVATKCVS